MISVCVYILKIIYFLDAFCHWNIMIIVIIYNALFCVCATRPLGCVLRPNYYATEFQPRSMNTTDLGSVIYCYVPAVKLIPMPPPHVYNHCPAPILTTYVNYWLITPLSPW